MISFKPFLIVAGLLPQLFSAIGLQAQNIPDSLLEKLATVSNDSTKAITLLEIGESIEQTIPEKSMDYYRQALLLGKQIKNNRVIMSSYTDLGICYINLNKMDSAIMAFEKGIPFARVLKDTIGEARTLANIGNAHLHKKDRATAIEYYLKAARVWENCSNKQYLTLLYSNINALLDEQKEHSRALEFGNKAIALAEKIGDNYSLVNGLVNLSTTYGHLGQHEKEYELLERALPLAKKNEDLDQIATAYHNMGDYYFKKNEFSSALEKYLQSLSYVKQMGNKYHLCEICTVLAMAYHKLNQDGKAMQFILQAEQLADEVGVRTKLKEIYLTRAEIEQKAGNYKLAAAYYSKTLILSDSLFKTETSEKVAEVEAQYQNEKKQKEIVQLEKDKQIQSLSIKEKSTLNYFLIGSLAALLILGFLVYRNLRNRQLLAKQQDELQQQRIRELEKDKQLVAVDSMLKGQEEERSRLAKDLHDGLGGLLSGVKFSLSNMKDNLFITPDNMAVFERSLDMLDTSIRELRRVAHNMMPELLTKFGLDEALKEYCNTINATKLLTVKYQSHGMETRIDKSVEIIVYRIIQELLNNTLKHAAATEAFVQVIREDSRLNIVVEDNGKGFDATLPENNKGAGWANIRSRVEYLKGRLDVHSEQGKGTLVNIEFNI
ncbi:MAG TPA: sensor histidine kinase [Chitinophagaceae bacterium]|nr:sensor histidine kinase [Chitinophagaceae bacterium]